MTQKKKPADKGMKGLSFFCLLEGQYNEEGSSKLFFLIVHIRVEPEVICTTRRSLAEKHKGWT